MSELSGELNGLLDWVEDALDDGYDMGVSDSALNGLEKVFGNIRNAITETKNAENELDAY